MKLFSSNQESFKSKYFCINKGIRFLIKYRFQREPWLINAGCISCLDRHSRFMYNLATVFIFACFFIFLPLSKIHNWPSSHHTAIVWTSTLTKCIVHSSWFNISYVFVGWLTQLLLRFSYSLPTIKHWVICTSNAKYWVHCGQVNSTVLLYSYNV